MPILKTLLVFEIAPIEILHDARFTWLKPKRGNLERGWKVGQKVEIGRKCVCTEPLGVPGAFSPERVTLSLGLPRAVALL